MTRKEFERVLTDHRSVLLEYAAQQTSRGADIAEDLLSQTSVGLLQGCKYEPVPVAEAVRWIKGAIWKEAKRWKRDQARQREVSIPEPPVDEDEYIEPPSPTLRKIWSGSDKYGSAKTGEQGEDHDQGKGPDPIKGFLEGAEPDIPEPLDDTPEVVDNRDRHPLARPSGKRDPLTCPECGQKLKDWPRRTLIFNGRPKRVPMGQRCVCGLGFPYDVEDALEELNSAKIPRVRQGNGRNRKEILVILALHVRMAWEAVRIAERALPQGVWTAISWIRAANWTLSSESNKDVAEAKKEIARDWGVSVRQLARLLEPHENELGARLKTLFPGGIGHE